MYNRKRLKVLFIYENISGGELVETELLLSEFRKSKSFKLKVLILDPLIQTGLMNYFFWIFKNVSKSFLSIIQKRPDVIYTTTFTGGVAAVIAKIFLEHKIIFHYHGSRIPPKHILTSPLHKATQLVKYYASFFLHNIFIFESDAIIAPSEFTQRSLSKDFRISESRIQVIPNGINVSGFGNLTASDRLRGLEKKFVISAVGRYNDSKNLSEVVRLFTKFIDLYKKPAVLLLLCSSPQTIGEISYKKKLRNLISHLGLGNKILLIEGKDNLAPYYHSSDLIISLSKVENLPMSMLESFASGVIYCASTVGEVKNVLAKIDPMLLIRETNTDKIAVHIINIANLSKERKADIINKERRMAKNYSVERTFDEIQKLLASFFKM